MSWLVKWNGERSGELPSWGSLGRGFVSGDHFSTFPLTIHQHQLPKAIISSVHSVITNCRFYVYAQTTAMMRLKDSTPDLERSAPMHAKANQYSPRCTLITTRSSCPSLHEVDITNPLHTIMMVAFPDSIFSPPHELINQDRLNFLRSTSHFSLHINDSSPFLLGHLRAYRLDLHMIVRKLLDCLSENVGMLCQREGMREVLKMSSKTWCNDFPQVVVLIIEIAIVGRNGTSDTYVLELGCYTVLG